MSHILHRLILANMMTPIIVRGSLGIVTLHTCLASDRIGDALRDRFVPRPHGPLDGGRR